MRKLIAFILVLTLFLPLYGLAESGDWTCPNCGQAGNTGNFCTECGTAKPWDCSN